MTGSIHATLAGGDLLRQRWEMQQDMFLSTPPSRVATHFQDCLSILFRCFYPRHPRGWRPLPENCVQTGKRFYPRHPRGWRQLCLVFHGNSMRVSIHATLAGGDLGEIPVISLHSCFYPRHPRGWRPATVHRQFFAIAVSIHATLAGGDRLRGYRRGNSHSFLSTPPSRVATTKFCCIFCNHACFYPRHPRGWRRQKCTKMYSVFCAKGKKLSVKSKII